MYQRTVDYPDELADGFHVMLDTEELVTVGWEQVEGLKSAQIDRQSNLLP